MYKYVHIIILDVFLIPTMWGNKNEICYIFVLGELPFPVIMKMCRTA